MASVLKGILSMFLIHYLVITSRSSLVVNVKTKRGDITQEEIDADPEKDLVTLDYKLNDGQYVNMLIDFQKKVQIFRMIVLGEMERGESPYQSACFVTKFSEGEFISSDAMSKLRQKNAETVRVAEEELKTVLHFMDFEVVRKKSSFINEGIAEVCRDTHRVYVSGQDLHLLSAGNTTSRDELLSVVHNLTQSMINLKRCSATSSMKLECVCRYQLCISWYPCELKYCQDQDGDGQQTSYRCGIKTCSKCRNFDFHVNEKQQCFWDRKT